MPKLYEAYILVDLDGKCADAMVLPRGELRVIGVFADGAEARAEAEAVANSTRGAVGVWVRESENGIQ